jgi:hypothetical protein
MKFLFKIVNFICISFLLVSCAGEAKKASAIDNDQVYQRYTSSYTEGGSGIAVRAEFRSGAYWDRLEEEKTGGDAVELNSPNDITFNGAPMVQDKDMFTGTYYKLTTEGAYTPEQTWIWTDAKGKQYKNTIVLNPIRPTLIKYYRRDSIRVEWGGGAVGENEKVIVRFEGRNSNKKDKTETSSETVTQKGATGVTMGWGIISDLSSIDLELERVILVRASESNSAEGTIKATYTSKQVSANSSKTF